MAENVGVTLLPEQPVARRFGTGELLMIIGGVIGLLFMLLLLIWYIDDVRFDWLAMSLIVLMALDIWTVVAGLLSMSSEKLLLVPYAWCGLVTVMQVGQASTLWVAKLPVPRGGLSVKFLGAGVDFFILLGAVLVGLGAYMAQKGIGVFPDARAPIAAGPEDQLAKLKDMFDRGLISEEDYNRKRSELVQRL